MSCFDCALPRIDGDPDSNVADGVREMRTIIVIDEAHHFLKDKKRNAILERLIREIRSKGASVFLMSQSPDDYDQDNFDFTELLEFIFLLQSNARSVPLSAKCLWRFGAGSENALVGSGKSADGKCNRQILL